MSIETMTKLASYTVTATSEATITFSNIPQTYTDLVVRLNLRNPDAVLARQFRVLFNNNTSSIYSYRHLYSDTGAAYSSSESNIAYGFCGWFPGGDTTSNTFGNAEVYIPGYSGNTTKSYSVDYVMENNSVNYYSGLTSGIWGGTSGINQITFITNNGNFMQNSTVTLYGVRNMRRAAGNSVKATGGNITFDGTYVVHTFNSSGTFTPTAELTDVDYLIVAGGGGGSGGSVSGQGGGGGGAGGLRSTVTATGGGSPLESAISLSPNINYAVVVGAGGSPGASGSNSAFSTQFSTGGGGGGEGGNAGLSGGSGGGPSAGSTGRSASSGTAGQGYASGNTILSPQNNYISAGGGGAGAVGGNGTTGGVGGAGGAGVQVGITGSLRWYAAGGGGGTGQFAGATTNGSTNGIGGVGGFTNPSNTAATAGAQSTGSGGGGGNSNTDSRPFAGGSGGSGVVIIRYKA